MPSDRLEWHGHNDFHKVHINGATAWLYGCDAVNGTLFGYGERTGNPPLEGALMEYIALKGDLCGIQTEVITEAGRVHAVDRLSDPGQLSVRREVLQHDPSRHPRRRPAKDERIYNIFDTAKLLGRPPRVALTDKSGADGVALWVNEFFGLKGEDRISKIKIHKVARWVMDQYEVEGRMTAISDEELEQKVQELMPDYWEKYHSNGA